MIRKEMEADVDAIRSVLVDAFPTSDEADLVEQIRANGNLKLSLVSRAPIGNSVGISVSGERYQIDGHIAFSSVEIVGTELSGVGLAPVAVLSSHQRRGVGRKLIEVGLSHCRNMGYEFVVVLGDPGYYKKFGFYTASKMGLGNEYGVDEEFMVIELVSGCLSEVKGKVLYSKEFRQF